MDCGLKIELKLRSIIRITFNTNTQYIKNTQYTTYNKWYTLINWILKENKKLLSKINYAHTDIYT